MQSRRSLPSPNRPILIARLSFSSDPALAISDANVIDHELCKAFAFGPGRNWIGHGGSFRDFLLVDLARSSKIQTVVSVPLDVCSWCS